MCHANTRTHEHASQLTRRYDCEMQGSGWRSSAARPSRSTSSCRAQGSCTATRACAANTKCVSVLSCPLPPLPSTLGHFTFRLGSRSPLQRKCEWMTVPYRSASELSDNICGAAQRVCCCITTPLYQLAAWANVLPLSIMQRGISNIICGSRGLGTLERCDTRVLSWLYLYLSLTANAVGAGLFWARPAAVSCTAARPT